MQPKKNKSTTDRCNRHVQCGALLLGLMLIMAACSTLPETGPESFDTPTLTRWLAQQRQHYQLPALGIVLINSEQLLALAVDGQRSVLHSAAAESSDRWHLGSISKSMTAMLAALLVADGLIEFDTTVDTVLAGHFADIHADYRNVTLDQLLRHHGGLPEDLQQLPLWQQMDTVASSATSQRYQLLHTLLQMQPVTAPGHYAYSNASYVLAATMLEAVSGNDWEYLIKTRLFAPLALHSAGIGPPGLSREYPDQPWGHRREQGGQPMPPGPFADHPPALAPAGRIHLSLPDLATYLQLHLRLAAGSATEAQLPAAIIRQLYQPAANSNVAAGWFIEQSDWSSAPILTHSGSNTFWHALVQVSVADDLALAVVSNQLSADSRALERVASAAANAWPGSQ